MYTPNDSKSTTSNWLFSVIRVWLRLKVRHQCSCRCDHRRCLLEQGRESCSRRRIMTLLLLLLLLTMMLMKCPLLEHRSEQIRSGYRRATRCRVPITTRVQSMPPSDRAVVAADRRQHRHHRRSTRPVLLRRTGDAGRPPTRRVLDRGDLACRRDRRPPPTTSKSTPVAASRLPLDRQRLRYPIAHRLAARDSRSELSGIQEDAKSDVQSWNPDSNPFPRLLLPSSATTSTSARHRIHTITVKIIFSCPWQQIVQKLILISLQFLFIIQDL